MMKFKSLFRRQAGANSSKNVHNQLQNEARSLSVSSRAATPPTRRLEPPRPIGGSVNSLDSGAKPKSKTSNFRKGHHGNNMVEAADYEALRISLEEMARQNDLLEATIATATAASEEEILALRKQLADKDALVGKMKLELRNVKRSRSVLHKLLLPTLAIPCSDTNGVLMRKVEFKVNVPSLTGGRVESAQGKNSAFNTFGRDSISDFHVASQPDYSSPVASLVLTNSSQLTSDSQHLAVSCQLSAVSCHSAPKKPWGYYRRVRQIRIMCLSTSAGVSNSFDHEGDIENLVNAIYLPAIDGEDRGSNLGRAQVGSSKVLRTGLIFIDQATSGRNKRNEHNPLGDAAYVDAEKLMANIRDRATTTLDTPTCILAFVSSEASQSGVAKLPSVPNMKRKIRNIRMKANAGPAELQDGSKLIFSTQRNLQLLGRSKHWYANGTFETVHP
uniref:Uncharacterized protein n=1 Tax=Timema cristinae TaxID=61476 RepID=A0A7R9CFN5_TIMCR|nr:unnamed protein product [Timema cristinae]